MPLFLSLIAPIPLWLCGLVQPHGYDDALEAPALDRLNLVAQKTLHTAWRPMIVSVAVTSLMALILDVLALAWQVYI